MYDRSKPQLSLVIVLTAVKLVQLINPCAFVQRCPEIVDPLASHKMSAISNTTLIRENGEKGHPPAPNKPMTALVSYRD